MIAWNTAGKKGGKGTRNRSSGAWRVGRCGTRYFGWKRPPGSWSALTSKSPRRKQIAVIPIHIPNRAPKAHVSVNNAKQVIAGFYQNPRGETHEGFVVFCLQSFYFTALGALIKRASNPMESRVILRLASRSTVF